MTRRRATRVLDRLTALHPKVIDLSLDRIERLLAALGHPERRLPPVIHVAGTNGKGSVVAMIRAGARGGRARASTSTPRRTSPASTSASASRRRSIAEDRLIAARSSAARRRTPAQPITFFEITTAAAFLAMPRPRPTTPCSRSASAAGSTPPTSSSARG